MEARNYIPPKSGPAALIAIRDPSETHPPYNGKWVDILRLKFWDVERLTGGYDPASKEQMLQIWEFIQKHKDIHIFAHCEAGISRSGAIRQWLNNAGWVVHRKLVHKVIHPNQHVYQWLRYFERGGHEYQWPMAEVTKDANTC